MFNSSMIGKASFEVANRLAGNAAAVGESTYEAARTTVTVGRRNESRAGAVVREVNPNFRDARDQVLLRTADSMTELR